MRKILMVLAVLVSGAAAAAGENGARKSPLVGLPSKAGAHIEKIKALGDNSWLKLGAPAPDPKWGPAPGRSYTPKMAAAPDLGGAFLYGTGPHGSRGTGLRAGYYDDDLFFYDAFAHRWICVHPGTNIKDFKMKLNGNDFEVTEDDEPVPIAPMCHGGETTAYAPDMKKFAFLPAAGAYWRKSLKKRRDTWLGDEPVTPGRRDISPWFYDVPTARWELHKPTGTIRGKLGFVNVLVYLSGKKQFVYLWANSCQMQLYDVESNKWTLLKPTGTPPSRVKRTYEGLCVYDAKRNRLYVLNDNQKSIPWIYDVAANTWIDPQPKDQPAGPLEMSLRTGSAAATYDSVNDAIVVNQRRGAGKPGTSVYDVVANSWTIKVQPFPAALAARRGSLNAFFSPELNAHIFHVARDGRPSGTIWVYRYKKAAAGKGEAR
ncbi:MAG: Kelch repeat-containing protein [Planctomycetota bacterium]|jgi:hypothetical protein